MQTETRDIAIIGAITAVLLFYGIRGIRKKGRAYQRKDLSDAHYVLSLGETATGIIALGYLVYWFWQR